MILAELFYQDQDFSIGLLLFRQPLQKPPTTLFIKDQKNLQNQTKNKITLYQDQNQDLAHENTPTPLKLSNKLSTKP